MYPFNVSAYSFHYNIIVPFLYFDFDQTIWAAHSDSLSLWLCYDQENEQNTMSTEHNKELRVCLNKTLSKQSCLHEYRSQSYYHPSL